MKTQLATLLALVSTLTFASPTYIIVDNGTEVVAETFGTADEYPTPPWTKNVTGSGSANGEKAAACAAADAASKATLADKNKELEATCIGNKGKYSFSDSGSVCMYNKVSQVATFTSYATANCQ